MYCQANNWTYYRWNEEWDPAHGDKHGGGEVHAQDEWAQGPRQPNLEPIHAIVAWNFKENISKSFFIIKQTMHCFHLMAKSWKFSYVYPKLILQRKYEVVEALFKVFNGYYKGIFEVFRLLLQRGMSTGKYLFWLRKKLYCFIREYWWFKSWFCIVHFGFWID